MARGLFDPLGTDREVKRRSTRIQLPLLTSGLVLVAVAVLLIASVLRDDGSRGEPGAVATIQHVALPASPPKPAAREAAVVEPAAVPTPSALPPVRDDQEVEIQNGVRIIRPRRGGSAAGGQVLKVPAVGTPNAAAPAGPGRSMP
jgi:hypothetical protein